MHEKKFWKLKLINLLSVDSEYFRSSLRLFLSADISGSTAFKHTSSGPQNWQKFFQQFFKYVPTHVASKLVSSELNLTPWKSVGDEIVFTSELTHFRHVKTLVESFRKAVADYRRSTTEVELGRLDIKITGWTAGFPVGNMLLNPLSEAPTAVDFIGPSMDIGFRLVKYSNPRRMYISVELAWLLSHPENSASGKNPLRLYFDGLIPLKGVGKEGLYPGIWMDNFRAISEWNDQEMDDSARRPDPFSRDKLLMDEENLSETKTSSTDSLKLHEYCAFWLQEKGFPFMVPFIIKDPIIGLMPVDYEVRLKKLKEEHNPADFPETISKEPPSTEGSIKGKGFTELFQSFLKNKPRNH